MIKNNPLVSLITEAAQAGVQIVRQQFRQAGEVDEKGSHIDIVTKTDLASQAAIRQVIEAGMLKLGYTADQVGFIEEESVVDSVAEHTFIVDPVDGTTNFAAGIPFSCISIGYAHRQELKIGVVAEPFTGTVYSAVKGEGAFLNNQWFTDRRLNVEQKETKNWIVGAHLNGMDVVLEQFALYQKLYPQVRGERNIGSLTLDVCMMADNVFDVIFNRGCFFWDLAAAKVILNEAGGEIFDLNGEELQFEWQNPKKKYSLIACHREEIDHVLNLVSAT